MKKNNTLGLVFGVFFLLIGCGYLARAFGFIPEFTIFFDGWWTMFIIIPCFCGIVGNNRDDKTGYFIGLVIGLLFLLMAQHVISSGQVWAMIVAAIFVLIGINLLLPKKEHPQSNQEERKSMFTNGTTSTATDANGNKIIVDEIPRSNQQNGTGNGEKIVCSAIFAGRDIRVDNTVFGGADLTGIFGGIDLNLKNAIITENVTIIVKAIFGGVDILVPAGVRVVVDVTPIMGGVENGTHAPLGADENTPTIFIKGSAVFGGIEVK